MITEIPVNLTYAYSCQICGVVFETREEWEIVPGLQPVCSYKCKFRLVYNILKMFDTNDLLIIFYHFNPHTSIVYNVSPPESQRKELIFDNARHYTKLLLSRIKGGIIIIK